MDNNQIVGNWIKLRMLGEGGQGEVWLAYERTNATPKSIEECRSLFVAGNKVIPQGVVREHQYAQTVNETIWEIANRQVRLGALKLLHPPEKAKNSKLAAEQMRLEIQAMRNVEHPSLLRILDVDDDAKWYVSEYYPKGTLANRLQKYSGQAVPTLAGIRKLLDGLSALHAQGIYHRDIKPENIFVGDDELLVLGDFGIAIRESDSVRPTGTFENKGSRDWMPGWAFGKRVESVKATFDIFSIGKVIWSMISGQTHLQLWYWNRPEFNLEKLFPNSPEMSLVNELISRCVVEEEIDCLQTVETLVELLDTTLRRIQMNLSVLSKKVVRHCQICGIGSYEILADRNNTDLRNLGINPAGTRTYRLFSCTHCGHVQQFAFRTEALPSAWKD